MGALQGKLRVQASRYPSPPISAWVMDCTPPLLAPTVQIVSSVAMDTHSLGLETIASRKKNGYGSKPG